VLGSYEDDFTSRLRELAHRFNATLLLDAVGGAQTQSLVDVAPVGSTILVYAALAGEPSTFSARTLIGGDKRIVGFYLGRWAAQKGLWRTLRDVWRVRRLANSDLQTTIFHRLPLAAAQEAVEMYRSHMTSGKVLLVGDREAVPLA
jgi:NADPH:quinone reductase